MNARTITTAAALASALLFASPAAFAAPTGSYTFDAAHTFVTFKIGRANASPAYGMFAGGDGKFVYDPSN
ncbi:MAG: hypothetical protein AAF658_15605, partial [Myxococcota bacterium]